MEDLRANLLIFEQFPPKIKQSSKVKQNRLMNLSDFEIKMRVENYFWSEPLAEKMSVGSDFVDFPEIVGFSNVSDVPGVRQMAPESVRCPRNPSDVPGIRQMSPESVRCPRGPPGLRSGRFMLSDLARGNQFYAFPTDFRCQIQPAETVQTRSDNIP